MYHFIVVYPDKCTGCQICELACSLYNERECNPEKARIRIVRVEEDGIIYTIPVVCQQCEKPLCMEMCPVEAISRTPETGAIVVNKDKCLGCKRCAYACPYGAITVDPDRGFAVKCTLCDGNPQCVEFCPKNALEYVRADKINIRQRREGMWRFLEFQKSVVGSIEDKEE